jgi:hypothetical protein
VVEEKKRSSERSYYLDPLLYNKPEEKKILWKRHPQAAKRQAEPSPMAPLEKGTG